jgi:hypothetical protein
MGLGRLKGPGLLVRLADVALRGFVLWPENGRFQ